MSLGYGFQSGVSSLKSFSEGLEVIGNNISNVSTTGFKKGRAEYADSFYNMLVTPSNNASKIGSGSHVTGVSTQFDTEDAKYTGKQSDLAINGNGFFRVVNPSDGNTYYTRGGGFTRDTNGYLTTPQGYRLQGTGTLSGGDVQVPETATNPTSGQTETVSSWSFSATTGKLSLYFSDGTSVDAGQIQLSSFSSPEGLATQGGNTFKQTDEAGTRTDFLPSSTASASVTSQYLEQSNVDLTEELTNMIVVQRGFQAGSRVITTTDQLMQEAIKLKS